MELIISLISGAVGGNLAGGLMKNLSLGTLWNSIAGIAGGGIGGSLLGMLGLGAGTVWVAATSARSSARSLVAVWVARLCLPWSGSSRTRWASPDPHPAGRRNSRRLLPTHFCNTTIC